MSIRNWNNDGSELRTPVIAESNLTDTLTVAVLVKLDTYVDQALMLARESGGANRWVFNVNTAGLPGFTAVFSAGGFQYAYGQVGIHEIPLDEWCLVAFTRHSLTVNRFHVIPLGGTPVHAISDLIGGFDPPGSSLGGYISFGGGSLDGLMAVAGIWNTAMSDNAVESLLTNLTSDDWANNQLAAPAGSWNFDQDNPTDPVPDMNGRHANILGTITGITDNNGITGTTTVSGQDPAGWDFTFTPPPLDFSLHLSGGASNTDPKASYGGTKSSISASIDLFDNVTNTERTSGNTDYRLIYVQNDEDADVTVDAVVFQQLESGRQMAVGVATQSAGVEVPPIANDRVAPAGVTFQPSNPVTIGTLTPGQSRGVWLRRTTNAATPVDSSNHCEIRFTVTLL